MGITDPAQMQRIKNEGLMAHPEAWKHLFNTIEKYGGLDSILGVGMAEAFGLPTSPEKFNALKKATTDKEAPDYMGFLRRVLGPEESSKLSLAKAPQMFNVAKRFQEREARGEFKSPEEERQQLIAALQKEGAAMADELATRQAMVTVSQAWTDAIDQGVKAFTYLTGTSLPMFSQSLLEAAEFLDNLNPFNTKPSAANIEKIPPDVTKKIWEATAKQAKIATVLNSKSVVDALQGADVFGSPMVPKKSGLSPLFKRYFGEASAKTGVRQAQLEALGFGESEFRQKAVSHKNALGVMQVVPGSHPEADQWKLANDPAYNILYGSRHFARLLKKYKNDDLAVAAYNRGEKNVPVGANIESVLKTADAAGYPETRKLVEKYRRYLNRGSAATPDVDVDRNEGMTNTWKLVEQHNQYLAGHATIYVDARDKQTGELIGQTKVPLLPKPGVTGLPHTSTATREAPAS